MIRIVLADDSATARMNLRAIVERSGDIQVVAEAVNGLDAVDKVEAYRPDLVVMDVHMPGMDGLEATKQIMARIPTPIIIVSAVRPEDVDHSLSATEAGALIALAKPGGPGTLDYDAAADQLVGMVRAMSQVMVVRRWQPKRPDPQPVPAVSPRAHAHPELIAIAASTGGPGALRQIFGSLPASLPVPIVLVQHIAAEFTQGFADWLSTNSRLPVRVAADGEAMRAGTIYVAPGDHHLTVTPDRLARLDRSPAIGGFRPSATRLFESAGAAFGPRLVAVILTGMGSDGADGLLAAHMAGAFVLAQDRASSVVYGMAHEADRRGAVDLIIPLDEVAPSLIRLMGSA